MLRQAESYYIDSNMLQNLPKFVSYIFSQNALAFPSLISPLKVKKSPTGAVYPAAGRSRYGGRS